MKAVAIKKGQTSERAPGLKEMGTLRCDSCGEEFIVLHDPAFVDKKAAERQAQWLDKVLADEHERERKHSNRIQLPRLDCSCCRMPRLPVLFLSLVACLGPIEPRLD